jgi:hypothetical protein
MDVWTDGRIVRCAYAGRDAPIHARTHACTHARTHARRRTDMHAAAGRHGTHRTRHSKTQPLRPLPGIVLCRMCRAAYSRIRRSGNRRTGAQLQRERVDAGRGGGNFGIEVDATVDCVPVATSHVGRLQGIAQAAPIGLVRDDGRAPACLLVVEREKARRAARAV